MARVRIFPLVCAVAIALSATGAARAQEEKADSAASFFTAAEAAFARGEYRAAALAFEEAYRRAPRGATIYNGALAWERAQSPERAADGYALAAASSDLPAERAAAARARVTELARHLGRVDVDGPSDVRVTIEHVVDRAPPFRVYLVPGRHSARVVYGPAKGPDETREVVLGEGAVTSMSIAPRVISAPPASGAQEPATSEERPSRTMKILGFAAIGTGVVATGAAITMGVMGLSARDRFENSGFTDQRQHDRAVEFRTGANIAWITAGVLTTAGVLLVLFSPSSSRSETRKAMVAGSLLSF